MSNQIIFCPDCNAKHNTNPNKHRFRPKYCTVCRAVIANATPKNRVLSMFQRRKKERKKATRKLFVEQLMATGVGLRHAVGKLTKVFEGED